MKFKIGDKLLCKKDNRYLNCGDYYNIVKITEFIYVGNKSIGDYDRIDDWFEGLDYDNYKYIYNWFYTKDEIRKIKLDKINTLK